MEQQPPAYTPSGTGSMKTPTGDEEDPFKDPGHSTAPNENENPFNDVEHGGAVKYA